MKLKPYKEIKAWMVLNDVKQKDFAKTLNISVSFVNRKLNRRRADFTLSEARRLASVYKIPLSYFFTFNVPNSEHRGN